jgi:hypothetical protein
METQNENKLDKYFDSIKEEKYKESFNDVENWLRREVVYSYEKQEKSKFTLLKNIFSGNRLKFAYLFIILILVGITSNFSVTRTEPVGIVMSWSVDKQNPEAIKKIDEFDWIDKSKLIVNEENADGKQVLTYKILIPSANMEEIEILKKELENTKDVHSVNLISISEPVKQPLYAVALGKVFNIGYEKNLVNPDEIKNNIFEQLKIAGLQNDVNFVVPDVGSAGRYVNFDFGKKPDSIRIKVHCDAVKEYDIEKALDDVDMLLAPVKIINDSILKTIVIKVNGDEVNTNVIISEVQRNLDTLHFKLQNSESKRKERMERFEERMEKFNERMERFNKSMEKYNKKMEKLNEKMKELNIPDEDIDIELNENGELNINIDIPEIPEIDIPEIEIPDSDEKEFNIHFDFDNLNNDLKIHLDTMEIRIDMGKINDEVKESMKKVKEDMKRLKEDMKKNKIDNDSSKTKIYYNEDEDEIYDDSNDDIYLEKNNKENENE